MTKSSLNTWGIAIAVMVVVLGNGKAAMAIEKAKYEVLEKEVRIELRQYEPRIVAETFVEGDFEKVGSEGFRRLYDYISGNNRKKLSIAMTAPVTQEGESQKIAMTAPVNQVRADNQWRITFIMPSEFALDDLPVPVDDRLRITQEPARLVAAISYSGGWGRKRYEKNKKLLSEFIASRGLIPVGEPVWARYDPPFMPWFLRRNEVLIFVEQ